MKQAIAFLPCLDGVEAIESFAFYYCKSLSMVTIPKSVTFIVENAFDENETVIKSV